MKQIPLVSVCLPTFKGAEYLQETLDSIEVQTYAHIEVIVSDDGSQEPPLRS